MMIDVTQRSEEWTALRVGKATASRFGDIMAKTPAPQNNYKAELVIERITGEPYKQFVSTAMDWGSDTEDLARVQYMLKTGNRVDEAGFFVHDTLACGASPDGLIGKDGNLEIKCPNSATHIETLHTRKIPNRYIAQVQGEMWLSGRLWTDYISFDPRLPDNASLIILRVERDDTYIADLEARVTEFLADVDKETEFIKSYGVTL